jgi:hypothetical protein
VNIYDDKNYTHYGANHPKVPGIAYFDKHVQPSGNSDVGQVLTNPVNYLFSLELLWKMDSGVILESVGIDPSNR